MHLPEKTLQRAQLCVAILAGTVTFIVGAYQTKNLLFPKKETIPAVTSSPDKPNPIRSAVEDVGAEWIRKWGKPESSTGQSGQSK